MSDINGNDIDLQIKELDKKMGDFLLSMEMFVDDVNNKAGELQSIKGDNIREEARRIAQELEADSNSVDSALLLLKDDMRHEFSKDLVKRVNFDESMSRLMRERARQQETIDELVGLIEGWKREC